MALDTNSANDTYGRLVETQRWYVVYSQPRRESFAAQNLSRQGYENYCPTFDGVVRHARTVRRVRRPLFPRYIFVALDLSKDHWRSILGTYGVTTMLLDGDRPRQAPAGLVAQLKRAELAGSILVEPDRLKVGDDVRFLTGPFAEVVGRLVGLSDGERVRVLLDVMGAERVIDVSARQLVQVRR